MREGHRTQKGWGKKSLVYVQRKVVVVKTEIDRPQTRKWEKAIGSEEGQSHRQTDKNEGVLLILLDR